ncbi:39S ribosomal protein L19, mitochondrial, partial [Caerostris darwini]
MSVLRKILSITNQRCFISGNWQRLMSQQATAVVKKESEDKQNSEKSFSQLSDYRFIYPEFLPDPTYEFRNKIREKLERQDMLKRRSVIHIPEFYVGSVLAVTASDPYAPGKENRFVGICIGRTYEGLRASFTLRNTVDKQ